MRAVVYEKDGISRSLICRDVEKPEPRAGEVLVKIRAVSLNAADYRSIRLGSIPKRGIFGADIAGIVEAVGANVSRFRPGDDVVGDLSACGFGGLAEFVAAPESTLVIKPAGISFDVAAAVPIAAETALQALRDKGGLQPGQKVLVCGAGGGVGTFAVQLARHLGADVTAVCGAENMQRMLAIGAHDVIDYTRGDFLQAGRRYDLVLAVNGKYPIMAYMRALNPNGVCVVLGGALSQVLKSILLALPMSLGGRKLRFLAAKSSTVDLELLLRLVESGAITPVIERWQPLEEAGEALKYLSGGHARGKVVVRVC